MSGAVYSLHMATTVVGNHDMTLLMTVDVLHLEV